MYRLCLFAFLKFEEKSQTLFCKRNKIVISSRRLNYLVTKYLGEFVVLVLSVHYIILTEIGARNAYFSRAEVHLDNLAQYSRNISKFNARDGCGFASKNIV